MAAADLSPPPAAPSATDGPSSPAPRVALALAVATVVIGFGLGFAFAASRANSHKNEVAAGPVTSTTVVATSSSVVVASTSVAPVTDTTTVPVIETSTEPPTVTTAAPTSEATTVVTVATTRGVVTTRPAPPTSSGPPPTTVAAAHMVVAFSFDDQGRLVIPRGGSASITIANTGGQTAQWLVTGSGFVVSGAAQGNLSPGQLTTVTILPPPIGLPPTQTTGTISVLGAVNPSVPFVIPGA